MKRRSSGSLKIDIALTDQVARQSPVAAFEIMPIKEGAVGVRNTLLQTYLRRPAESTKLVDAQEFTWRAIRLGEVARDRAFETNDLGDEVCQIQDGNVFARTYVHMTFGGIGLHEMEAGVGAIVNMQEFAPRRASPPDAYLLLLVDLGLMRLAYERRHDMARPQVKIIP